MLTADTITDEQIRALRASVSDQPATGPDRCSWGRCDLRGKHPRMDCLSGHYCTEHALRIEREVIAAGQSSPFPSLKRASADEEIEEICNLALFGGTWNPPSPRHDARARCAEILSARMAAKEGK